MTVKLWRVHEIIAGFCRNPQDGSSARAVSFRPSRWSSELARSTVRRSPVSWCHLRQMAAPRGIRMKTSSPSSAPSGGGFCWYFPPGKHIALRCVVSNMNISKNFEDFGLHFEESGRVHSFDGSTHWLNSAVICSCGERFVIILPNDVHFFRLKITQFA